MVVEESEITEADVLIERMLTSLMLDINNELRAFEKRFRGHVFLLITDPGKAKSYLEENLEFPEGEQVIRLSARDIIIGLGFEQLLMGMINTHKLIGKNKNFTITIDSEARDMVLKVTRRIVRALLKTMRYMHLDDDEEDREVVITMEEPVDMESRIIHIQEELNDPEGKINLFRKLRKGLLTA